MKHTMVTLTHLRVPQDQASTCRELVDHLSAARVTAERFQEGTPEEAAANHAVSRGQAALDEAGDHLLTLTPEGRAEYQRIMLTLGMAHTTRRGNGIYINSPCGLDHWQATEDQALEALAAWKSARLMRLDSEMLHAVIECGWEDLIHFLELATTRGGLSSAWIPGS
ncbi:hypothetical protein [Specibacter sp. NPDC078692]|uniref:hypothetical protein n=1 Tax=Specibacter sp. NPDC078692 TaxID=3155818 RepID=UPI003448441E